MMIQMVLREHGTAAVKGDETRRLQPVESANGGIAGYPLEGGKVALSPSPRDAWVLPPTWNVMVPHGGGKIIAWAQKGAVGFVDAAGGPVRKGALSLNLGFPVSLQYDRGGDVLWMTTDSSVWPSAGRSHLLALNAKNLEVLAQVELEVDGFSRHYLRCPSPGMVDVECLQGESGGSVQSFRWVGATIEEASEPVHSDREVFLLKLDPENRRFLEVSSEGISWRSIESGDDLQFQDVGDERAPYGRPGYWKNQLLVPGLSDSSDRCQLLALDSELRIQESIAVPCVGEEPWMRIAGPVLGATAYSPSGGTTLQVWSLE